MIIKEFSDLKDFYQVIDPLLNNNEWKDVSVDGLEALIHLNLKLLVGQTDNGEIAAELQSKLQELSDRISEHFTEPAANNLAFELTGIAMGIFSKSETKADFTRMLPEMQQKILGGLTPKGTKAHHQKVLSSGLKDVRMTSKKLQAQAEAVKKNWVNEEAVSLRVYGCKNAAEAIDYVIQNQLTSANLSEFNVTDDDVMKLAKGCPNLFHLNIHSYGISDKALEHLKGMHLKSINLSKCFKITDQGLEHLKEMPLTSINLHLCNKITDEGLEYLKEMPLTSIDISLCDKITDKGLEYLKELRLINIAIYGSSITNDGLEHLKKMPLQSITFIECENITDDGLKHLKGKPLTSICFSYNGLITDQGLEHFKEMHLQNIKFHHFTNITDKGLKNFEGMPLQSISFNQCHHITDQGVENLKKTVASSE